MFHVKHVPCSVTNSDQDHPADRRQRQAQHAIRDEELLPVEGAARHGVRPRERQLCRCVARVQRRERPLRAALAQDGEHAALGREIGDRPALQRRPTAPQLSETAVERQQRRILAPPRVGSAVQRILEALHPGLVAVVDGGGAGEGEQEHRAQPQPRKPHRQLLRREPVGRQNGKRQ